MVKRLSWTVVAPPLALVAAVLTWGRRIGSVPAVLIGLVLAAAVLAAVHHAEVIAHRVGEPLGSVVLAVAVTVIEVTLIVTLMASGGDKSAALARDTVFAAVMITTTGIVGLSLLIGSLRYGVTLFNPEGSGAALATVTTLATLSLVLPTFTTSQPGPEFSPGQLTFAALASLGLYVVFVLTQTVRHRDFFSPVRQKGVVDDEGDHVSPPSMRSTAISVAMLLVALAAVVGLAKVESHPIETAVAAVGFPLSFVGVVIAMLVLLPGLRLGHRKHRADHPGHRGRVDLAERPAGARARRHPGGAAGADRRGERVNRGAGPGDAAPGRGAPGAPGGLRISRRHPVIRW